MQYTMKEGQRVRVRGVPGVYRLESMFMRSSGPRAAIADTDGNVKEVPVNLLRPVRYGRRRNKFTWR